MATAAGNNLGPPPIISLSSPLHPQPPTVQSSSSPSSSVAAISGGNGNLRESQAPNPGDLSGIFSVVLNRQQHQQNHHLPLLSHHHVRWPSFSMGNRSFWTKYCLLCTVCGSAATILAGIFLVVAALFRYYTTSIYYFETVPTYIPAILLSICGVSTIAFSCKRNRNIILLRITACWSLCSAALSSVITITTSLIHMNRLQTLKECVYTKNPPACTCYSHSFGMQGPAGPETTHYLFENTPDCDVIHGILYSSLRAVFAISVVAVLLSIFLCMLLYQLIGHERKKAYWSRIRRINSDWSADFIACLARPMPRERSSLLPLMMPGSGSMPMHGPSMLPHPHWGPPPAYEEVAESDRTSRHIARSGICAASIQPTHSFAGTTSSGFTGGGGFFNNRSSASFAFPGGGGHHPRRLRLVTSHSENSFRSNPDGLMYPHPFSPTITSVDPISIFKQHMHNANQHHNNHQHHHNSHHIRHFPDCPSSNNSALSNCNIAHHNNDYLVSRSPPNGMSIANVGRNFRSLSQSQVLQHSNEEDDCCITHRCGNHRSIPQSSSFLTNASGRNSDFSITSLSMPDNSSMSITMKSSNDIPLQDNNGSSHCCNASNPAASSLAGDDDDFAVVNNTSIEETGFSDQELSLTSNCTTSELRNRHGGGRSGFEGGGGERAASSSSTGAVGMTSVSNTNTVSGKGKSAPTTLSEPKIANANKNNSLNIGLVGQDSKSVINSDTDIILNKKALEYWGSLRKHKNFTYYGGGHSTSRRSRKDKNKSSLSKISSLPCSPFMNMRRKLFGAGGKSLECVQNLNYNFSYGITPMEGDNKNTRLSDVEVKKDDEGKCNKGSGDSKGNDGSGKAVDGRKYSDDVVVNSEEGNVSSSENCSVVAEVRPELA